MGRRTIVRRPYFSTHDQVIHLLRQTMYTVGAGARSIEHVDPLRNQLVEAQPDEAHEADDQEQCDEGWPGEDHHADEATTMDHTAREGIGHRGTADPVREHEDQPGPLDVGLGPSADPVGVLDRRPVHADAEEEAEEEVESEGHDSTRCGEDMDSAQKVRSAPKLQHIQSRTIIHIMVKTSILYIC